MNEGESDRKLPKIFAGKNLRMTQKKLHALIYSKKVWLGALKLDMHLARLLNTK